MGWLRYLRRADRDNDFAFEIEAYLAHEIDDNIAAGMSPRAAADAAHRKFGNVTAVKETVREMNTLRFLETVWQDLRYGARALRLDPGFFVVATLSLALGVGANTAIFHLLDAVRLRSLPVKAPQELAEVHIADNDHCCNGNFSNRRSNLTFAQWQQIRDQQQAFSGIFAWGDQRFNMASGGEARYAEGLFVTAEFFSTLGVSPILGRVFTKEDDQPGCGSPGTVISYPFWQREFGGDASVIGKKVVLEGRPLEVIGVTPASFFGVEVGKTFDVTVPACSEPWIAGEDSHMAKRNHWWLAAIGRLKPGWTLTRAIAQLQAISPSVFQATVPPNYTSDNAKWYVEYKLTADPAGSGVSSLRNRYEDPLLLLLSIAGLVLLIACANLANLMLARASAREREIAVRLAIGASRGRLIRQLLAESLLLAFIGAALGAVLAQGLTRYMVAFLTTNNNPLFVDLGTDWRLLGFTALLAVLTCVLFGLAPALNATRTDPGSAMKGNARGMTAGRERFGLRRALVVSQVALSLVLLVGALLFVRSLRNLTTLDAGFQQEGLLITGLDLSRLHYTPERRYMVYRDLLSRIRATPGVELAASTGIVPISGNRWNDRIQITGEANQDKAVPNFSRITAGYFRTLGTTQLAGRDFDDRDTPSSPKVAIVNEAFTRKFLKGGNPMGKQIRMVTGPGEPPLAYEIVGLTKDAKYQRLRDDFSPTIFVAVSQEGKPDTDTNILVRSRSSLGSLIHSLKQTIADVNPTITVTFQSFPSQVEDSLLGERLMATLSGFFGLLAAILATVGLYGVISYMVARRRKEIGIRIALGADRMTVLRLVLGEAGLLLAIGFVIGVALAVAAARTATSLLYGLKPQDPVTIGLAVLLLAAVALPASFLPARRASKLEPMMALREE